MKFLVFSFFSLLFYCCGFSKEQARYSTSQNIPLMQNALNPDKAMWLHNRLVLEPHFHLWFQCRTAARQYHVTCCILLAPYSWLHTLL